MSVRRRCRLYVSTISDHKNEDKVVTFGTGEHSEVPKNPIKIQII